MSAHLTVEFDQPRRLLFNMKAVKALVNVMGGDAGLMTIIRKLEDMHPRTLERALWAGLLHEEPALTVDIVIKRIEQMDAEGRMIGQLYIDVIKALNASKMFSFKSPDDSGNAQQEPAETS